MKIIIIVRTVTDELVKICLDETSQLIAMENDREVLRAHLKFPDSTSWSLTTFFFKDLRFERLEPIICENG